MPAEDTHAIECAHCHVDYLSTDPADLGICGACLEIASELTPGPWRCPQCAHREAEAFKTAIGVICPTCGGAMARVRIVERRTPAAPEPRRIAAPTPAAPVEPASEPVEDDPGPDVYTRIVDCIDAREAGGDFGYRSVDLATDVGITRNRLTPLLVELEGLGILSRTGKTRATRWFLG